MRLPDDIDQYADMFELLDNWMLINDSAYAS